MELTDAIQISDFDVTDDGFLVSKARFSRSGIQLYRVGEPSLEGHFADRPAGSLIRIYRPDDEVFSADSMASIAGKPLTIEHEGGFVTPENAKRVTAGFIGDAITRDGDHVVGVVRVTHADGIKAVESGKLQLSVGYRADLEVKSGTTPTGEAYDAIQRNIRANHVSLVSRGRCGGTCIMHDAAISDGKHSQSGDTPMSTKVIDCGGSQVEVSDAAAIAFKAMTDKHTSEIEAKDAVIDELEEKVKDSDKELAKAETDSEEAKKKLEDAEARLTPEALDAAVRERSEVIEAAHKLDADLDCTTLDAAGIRRAALEAIDVNLDGKSDAYVDAAFDARVEAADASEKTPAQRAGEALAGGSKTTDSGKSPRDAYMDRTANAFQGGND